MQDFSNIEAKRQHRYSSLPINGFESLSPTRVPAGRFRKLRGDVLPRVLLPIIGRQVLFDKARARRRACEALRHRGMMSGRGNGRVQSGRVRDTMRNN